jgi:hypothetical protein
VESTDTRPRNVVRDAACFYALKAVDTFWMLFSPKDKTPYKILAGVISRGEPLIHDREWVQAKLVAVCDAMESLDVSINRGVLPAVYHTLKAVEMCMDQDVDDGRVRSETMKAADALDRSRE